MQKIRQQPKKEFGLETLCGRHCERKEMVEAAKAVG
jgi:hypothetical protein